ncbi:MAG: hypothetical protein J2P25_21035 [Nocardiopsaceae bacterium]|nr:hypothetical protein [Nocardiopsaceae bacterium]
MDVLAPSMPISRAAGMEAMYRSRLPHSLDDLVGPDHGTIQLPLHVAWSGLTAMDLDRPRQCMSFYRTVLHEGQRDDLTAYLNHDLLVGQWPVLRNLVSPAITKVWEAAFPELIEERTTS